MLASEMPGRSHTGPLPEATALEREVTQRLRGHVERLAGDIGERNVWTMDALHAAAERVNASWPDTYSIGEQSFDVGRGRTVRNLEAVHPDGEGEVVILGAHYDCVRNCPGANDNASGVAVLLELARLLAPASPGRALRFVAFPNEEAPFFDTQDMGSLRYAQRCRERGEDVVAMLSLETMGCYFDEPGTQLFPETLASLGYPTTGNFIAFVANLASRALLERAIRTFRETTAFPSEGLAAPEGVPGVGWSDHAAFWRAGYPALMVTDTAPFRYPEYHSPNDTPDRLDYDRLARVTVGLAHVVAALAEARDPSM